MKLTTVILLAASLCIAGKSFAQSTMAGSQVLAFPGAEGYGKYTTGGRGGKVFIVTNLNDSGTGSLREAVNAIGPRTVVFAVSGTIALESPLSIKHNDITIAGQSAPGDGICLRNYTISVSADNVIIRYLRFRMGDERRQEDDSFNGRGHQNIIIDHCSMSWSVDETASFYYNRNFTMQWCLIAESLNHSVHSKGPHGYGGIWGGEKATFHHNLLASHSSRNPRFSGSSTVPNPPDELVDYINNVVFNWKENSTYGGEKGRYNMINNYYKPGPATARTRHRLLNPFAPLGQFYLAGNYIAGSAAVTADNWQGVDGEHNQSVTGARVDAPFPTMPIEQQSAQQAYQLVIQKAGASLVRDAVDLRILRDVVTGTPNEGADQDGIIDSQKDVGGWPELKSLPAPADTDKDGMPDQWEQQQGLNPDDASDAVSCKLSHQYTNLEVYLNSLIKN